MKITSKPTYESWGDYEIAIRTGTSALPNLAGQSIASYEIFRAGERLIIAVVPTGLARLMRQQKPRSASQSLMLESPLRDRFYPTDANMNKASLQKVAVSPGKYDSGRHRQP